MSLEVKGLDKLLLELKNKPIEIAKAVDDELTEAAKAIEERAATLAPVDRGLLRGNIFADVSKPLEKRVVAKTYYAAYLEFGTKKRFQANGRANIAKQFQGKSGKGDYFDFLNNILDWVKRKGISARYSVKTKKRLNSKGDKERLLQVAQAIANSIIRHGIKPANHGKGYFFVAYDELLPTIINNVKKIISK